VAVFGMITPDAGSDTLSGEPGCCSALCCS
jgi:hypothetical protein